MTEGPSIFWTVDEALRWITTTNGSRNSATELHNALASGKLVAYGRPLTKKNILARELGSVGKVFVYGSEMAPGTRAAIPPIDWIDIQLMTNSPFFVSKSWTQIYLMASEITTLWPEQKKPAGSAGKILDCQKWIEELRRAGPPPAAKKTLRSQAENQFKIGPRQFDRAWDQAAVSVINQAWGRAGRPRKNRTAEIVPQKKS